MGSLRALGLLDTDDGYSGCRRAWEEEEEGRAMEGLKGPLAAALEGRWGQGRAAEGGGQAAG